MKERESEFEDRRIDLEAAEWVSKRMRGFTPGEQDQFFEWMAANPKHSEWYGRHIRTWKKLNRLAQWKPEHSDKANPDLLKYNPPVNYFAFLGAIAASLILGLGIWSFSGGISRKNATTVQSFVAESYEKHILPDGSQVEMKNGSALKVYYGKKERRIELVSNEAHFNVEKNPDKPFIVRAMGVEFKAVGTAFSVKIGENEVELLVTEGVVEMSKIPQFSDSIYDGHQPNLYKQEVSAGQRSVSTIDQEVPFAVEQVNDEEIEERLKWKPRSLNFDQIPLQKVIEAFNLRNTTQIYIGDEALKNKIVVASFHTANIKKLIGLLEATMDVESHDVGSDRIILLMKDSKNQK